MKIPFLMGFIAVFINVFDMFIADIPFVYGNYTALIAGIIAMILGSFW